MKKIRLINSFILMLIAIESCEQSTDVTVFDEKNYVEVKKGKDDGYEFVITYRNKKDSTYLLKSYYLDSAHKTLVSKFFFHNGMLDGPYKTFVNGNLFIEGNNENGKENGDRIIYRNNRISERGQFKNGVKVGAWEEYDSKGNLIRRKIYDENGNLKEEKNFQ